jgi:carbonic anhydrase/acetyltransferase-like protein (isoleucine patch superfamily)
METIKPQIHSTSYIDKTAVIIGKVTIGKNCGVFPHAVIRGDQNTITIDEGSNIQDCCIIHCDKDHNVSIGKNVSIGHGAIVHGATIEDNTLIGMHATILNEAHLGKGTIIGANALVTANMIIPDNSLVIGIPGKIVKQDKQNQTIAYNNAQTYQKLSKEHKDGTHTRYQ